MSTFAVPVVKIEKLEKHPDADSLSITEVEGCPVICKTTDFKVGDLAIYVPVDAVVPVTDKLFAFLSSKEGQKTARIKAKRLRGIFSMGFLIPFQSWRLWMKRPWTSLKALAQGQDVWVGVDVASAFGIVKYVEPEPTQGRTMRLGGGRREPDRRFCPVYDIEAYRKHKRLFVDGEEVVVTEKVHGCNGRFAWRQEKGEESPRLFVGSRNFFVQETDENVWWRVARQYGLASKLSSPMMAGKVLYGEVYGQVQDLKYGTTQADPLRFAAFDIYDSAAGRFLDYPEFLQICAALDIPTVPVLYRGPFKPELIEPMALGRSSLASQIKEGIVIKPTVERHADRFGRVILKLVGEQYLLRKDGTEYQ